MIQKLCLILACLGLLAPTASAQPTINLDEQRVEALSALPSIYGSPLTAEDLSGKPVVLTFFASWCPPCHAEFDHLKEAQAHYGDEVTIVAVNIFELTSGFTDKNRLKRFLKRKSPPFHILGEGEGIADLFGKVKRIPTVFVFDGSGQPVLHFIHARGAEKTHVTPEELEAAIAQALIN